MKITDGSFTKEIKFGKSWDKRDPDPNKNYGIESQTLWFILKGPKGAIQFCMSTGCYIKAVVEEFREAGPYKGSYDPLRQFARDLGYHSPQPMYEGQKPMSNPCDVLGGTCYYDGSTLQAEEPMEVLMAKGEDALWSFLMDEYNYRFGKEGDV